MKTKTFFILCLLLGIGLTQLSAQNSNSDGTRTFSWYYPSLGWMTEVYCDGVQIDLIYGSGDAHVLDHWKNYVWQWEMFTWSGTGVSVWTGEKFTFSEIDKYDIPNPGGGLCHTHVKGDKGALYNLTFEWNWGEPFVCTQAVCTGNAK